MRPRNDWVLRLWPLFGALLVLGPSTGNSATLWVGGDKPGAFATVQEALDVAEYSDEILIAPGRYPGRVDFLGKRVSMSGAGIGLTQIEPGCGFTGSTGVDLAFAPPNAALQDLSIFADCSSPGAGPLSVWAPGPQVPSFLRVAIRGYGPISVLFGYSDSAPTMLAAVEDLYIDQLDGPCPANTFVKFLVGTYELGSVRRLFISSHCDGTVYFEAPDGLASRFENVLVQAAWGWTTSGLFAGGAVTLSHLTHAESEPWNGPAWVDGLHLAEANPMPSLYSSVIRASTRVPVFLACGSDEAIWDFHWNDFWADNPAALPMGSLYEAGGFDCSDPFPMEEAGNLHLDPNFVYWTRDGNMHDDNLCPAPGSPLIDAGDPDELDPDGTRADIGAFGGPYAFLCEEVMDADGDGYRPITGDCDDGNPDRWPFHDELPCDGVDQDCDGSDATECGDDDSSGLPDDDSADDDSADDDSADDDSASTEGGGDDDSAHPIAAGCGCTPSACALADAPRRPSGGVSVPFLVFAARRRRDR